MLKKDGKNIVPGHDLTTPDPVKEGPPKREPYKSIGRNHRDDYMAKGKGRMMLNKKSSTMPIADNQYQAKASKSKITLNYNASSEMSDSKSPRKYHNTEDANSVTYSNYATNAGRYKNPLTNTFESAAIAQI